jgi:N-acylneuraminate cytidylyltransferase
MTRVLAIIPARGGSKGLPGKNLRQLNGQPLIVWSIQSALAAARVTDTVVSTDDEEIAAVARNSGAQVPFIRPAHLATDDAPTEPVMLHAVETMEQTRGRYDAVVLLQPTSPLRLHGTLDRALAAYEQASADSLVGVAESHLFFWQDGDPPQASYDYRNRPRRQDIPSASRRYRETGSLYVTNRDLLMAEGNRLAGKVALFPMDEREQFEIDSQTDFAVLEALMKEDVSS